MTDPYLSFVGKFIEAVRQELPAPEVKFDIPENECIPERRQSKPCALVFSPHPDDECLMGALPLRLRKEADWQIINVAVTLGSNQERKALRKIELAKSCAVLGFDIAHTSPECLSQVRVETREQQPELWIGMVQEIIKLLKLFRPQAVFLPHEKDGHQVHIGAHFLVMDALAKMPQDFLCNLVQMEYWQPNEHPNLMVALKSEDAALLLKALCCHVGEVSRNVYNLRFPSYMIDNVRRGSERVSGHGAKNAEMDLAMIYRIDRWQNGQIENNAIKRIIGESDTVLDAFVF